MSEKNLIAVVDDDESFRTALVDALSSLGYGARGFSSAEQFVSDGGEEPYDCVITDIQMPGLSGFDLKKSLVERNSKVPVIMITAHAGPGLEATAKAGGAVCLLRKPFDTSALTACLEKAIQAR
ncbi:response regulator transcription factor [Rhodoplanes sp. Z2-YC6860]|uniref:response regulator transcription factor n=1 Tax=Rhodoplanes sp. Z2-YC6860 TaxID=674703 RepID=UPI00082BE9A9|nr:response regulator [Rhodoplanes sp. Z2-YC6860]